MTARPRPRLESTGWDFGTLTPLVLTNVLKQAGTVVYEPIHRLHVEAPTDVLEPLSPVLAL